MAKSEFSIQNPIAGLAALAGGQAGGSPYEMHLNIAGIMGESQSSTHLNEIELASFSWGVINGAQNPGNKSGKASISEITVTKSFDKSSVLLLKASALNQTIPKAVITWSKSTGGGKPEDFLTITLNGAAVMSVNQSSSRGSAGMGTETVALAFQTVNVEYKIQGKDGLLTSAGSWSYSLVGGK